ncbi:MAG: methylated-DNA--[protein]-cysteine S-methyltransferase [Sulfurospirillaceae bacterium]|nr:methylated-DNA--[protein]-cysteine S-methyltransferase [Sulfurospirillaceae bacterium]
MAKMTILSPLGKIIVTADEVGICSLDFDENASECQESNAHIEQLIVELDEYFKGKRKEFSVALNPKGTPFQRGVWEVLQSIPYGKTISYSEEADILGHPKAVRAVANANGKNPIPIVIPCHRVIAKGGGIGGYSGGLWRKEFMLDLEQKK